MSELVRRLGTWDMISVVVSGVIGSAIFLVPQALMRPAPSALAGMCVLLFAAALSLLGALAFAELSAMYPETGSEYVFIREAYGPLVAFLLSWSSVFVMQGGGIATVAVGFSTVLSSIWPLDANGQRIAAVALITVLAAVNYIGLREAAWVNNLFTALKLSGLAGMIFAVATRSQTLDIDWSWPAQWTLASFAAALIPGLWAFEGWNLSTYVAGEVKNPGRVLPRALIGGIALVILVYAISLLTYLQMLTPAEMAAEPNTGTAAVRRALGPAGALWVSLTMLVAIVGCTHTCILGGARMPFALARDGMFFRPFASAHPRFKTPALAVVAMGAWSALLAATGSYETLFSFVTFGAWIFYVLDALAVIVLRRKRPDLPRPYRMWGYPLTPLLFAATAAAFTLSTFWSQPVTSLIGLGIILLGAPMYFYFRSRRPA